MRNERTTGPDDRKLNLRLWAAWASLSWERLWPTLWPAVGVAGLFLAFALFDLFLYLPGWLHLTVLLTFVGATAVLLAQGLRGLRLPRREEALRRIEIDSGLEHRPLTALRDVLASGTDDPAANSLWEAHRQRMQALSARLRNRLPAPGLAKRDPMALRAALLLVLVIAAVGARHDADLRLARAFLPDVSGGTATAAALDIWVTPPAYTRLAPIFLRPSPTDDADGKASSPPTLSVPAGSSVLAQVHGGRGAPVLVVGKTETSFTSIDPGNHRIEQTVTEGDRLSVRQGGRTLGSWPIAVLPDQTPVIEFAQPPARSERERLRVDYTSVDDYGLVSVQARIRRADGGDDGKGNVELELPLPLPGVRPKEARSSSYHDLTPHPWAGMKVVITLTATDALNQTGTSQPVEMVLPERVFQHPVARALVEARRRLIEDPTQHRVIARILDILSARPDLFYNDTVAFLAMRVARTRLLQEPVQENISGATDIMWETALRIEEGETPVAQRDLDKARQDLADALERGADDAEIQKLTEQLKQALDRYLKALAEQLANRPEQSTQFIPPNMRMIDRDQLQRMVDQIGELAKGGARDAARQMLSQLQELMENMQVGRMMQPSPQMQQADRMMEALQQLMQGQRSLMDQTFRQSQQGGQQQQGQQGQQSPGQQGQPNGQPGQDGGLPGYQQQEMLRRMLGEVMRRLGEMSGDIPGELGRAEQAMRGSSDALARGEPGQSLDPQGEALRQLQQGAQAMMQQFMQQYGGMPGQGQQPGQAFGQSMDPLGRPMPPGHFGSMDDGTVQVPGESELQRAREILDELRRRAGDPRRPPVERDYIDRLLKRF